jgi:subtilisin family serine protease
VADNGSVPDNRVLIKLRAATALHAADPRSNLRPLYEPAPEAPGSFGVAAETRWFIADLPEASGTPWDLAHNRIADQLGIEASDVVFAEPDLVHNIYLDPDLDDTGFDFAAVGEKCEAVEQDGRNGKATGPADGWHLGSNFSQLGDARAAVSFTEPRTRIAHLDTGYFRDHITVPKHLRRDLERNFADRDGKPGSAEDPNNRLLVLDNSGHGTGTLSILAGANVDFLQDKPMGAAPYADIVPLRIADSVVLLRTSAFARALNYAVDINCDVMSMSMGGLPSEAWREAVDRAYLAGLCMVTAAGNNFGGLPTRNTVYPARFSRVIAAYGVMANGKPYAKLKNREMEGNSGPSKVSKHALAAYTPNIPWAVFGCPGVVRRNGSGTSSATPQIAAAAALWLEKYKSALPRDWHRVEAVRKALFDTAAPTNNPDELGYGILRARNALDVRPDLTRPQSKSDEISFAFLRVITGLGISAIPARERMFNLELAQRWLLNEELQKLVPDPDETQRLDREELVQFMDAVIADNGASDALRKHVASRYQAVAGKSVPSKIAPVRIVPDVLPACDIQPALQPPARRRLRVYAVDPSYSARLETAHVNEVVLDVRWEKLKPGPVGEYVAVRDIDASAKGYDPVNLNDPLLLARDGWEPSEGNAQFHQQMVYAVTMKTIEHFERALGRPVLWRYARNPRDESDESKFVPQLTIRPHALRKSNAFYSPDDVALLFGYFEAGHAAPADQMPGSRVYTCLSHDIVAHETTHAILDGMHRRFIEPTNIDVLAFHEAFADIVALMQHFTIPQVLELEIDRIRGDLEGESMLGSLAVQFGRATGGRGALRNAIGTMENGVWRRLTPDPAELNRRIAPHERGAILVAAVFDAFIAIYKTRTRDLLRIYTSGTGVLTAGAIHPDLVRRLSDEAAKSARHVLEMCIRALDYLPPVDVTFFEYLRALITADYDLISDDRFNYRVAFVEAFRRRGIYPLDIGESDPATVRTLSVETVRWQGLDYAQLKEKAPGRRIVAQYDAIVEDLKRYANDCIYIKDRMRLFELSREERKKLKRKIAGAFSAAPALRAQLGLVPRHDFDVHELRTAMRTSADGRSIPQVIVALTQTVTIPETADTPAHDFRGGSTLILDLTAQEAVKYLIFKRTESPTRRLRTATFVREAAADSLRGLFFAAGRSEPFAALHFLADDT